MKNKLQNLPESIKVKVYKQKTTGEFFAKLPEYDVFTEADTEENLELMINDLIYETFDIPKELQSEIRYVPQETRVLTSKVKTLGVLMSPSLFAQNYAY